VNGRERLHQTGIAAEAADAIVATLSARLDALLATWQLTIQTQGRASRETKNVKPRSASEVLAELQGQLNDLDLHIDTVRREVDTEHKQAADWEKRAMMALSENREDLAAQALRAQQMRANAAAVHESEVLELDAVRDAYVRAVSAVQTSLER
jgi:hypothetical protein